jgi:hypothetical protein
MPILGSSAGSTKGAPSAPTIGTATAGDASATVTFSAPSFSKLPITSYTVTASPGGATGTGSSSPITVSGLSNGTAYTFTVRGSHANGQSAASSASNSATPVAPVYALSQTFNSSGTYTVPAGASKIAVIVYGAGQAGSSGGTAGSITSGSGGTGGSSGAVLAATEYSVTPGTNYVVTLANSGATSFGNLLTANSGSSGGNFSNNITLAYSLTGTGGAGGGPGVGDSNSYAGPGVSGSNKNTPSPSTFSLSLTNTVNFTVPGAGAGGGSGGRNSGGAGYATQNGGAGGTTVAGGGNGGAGGQASQELPRGFPGGSGNAANVPGGGGGGGGGGGVNQNGERGSGGSGGAAGGPRVIVYAKM